MLNEGLNPPSKFPYPNYSSSSFKTDSKNLSSFLPPHAPAANIFWPVFDMCL